MSTKRGLLKFKGGFQKKLNKEKKILSEKLEAKKDRMNGIADLESLKSKPIQKKTLTFEEKEGSGRILTSAKSVMGKGTNFDDEVKSGDFLVVIDPIEFTKEKREIGMIFSDNSLMLKEPFSRDLSTYMVYKIKPQDRIVDEDLSLDEEYKRKMENITKKIGKAKTVVEYKKKKGMWGYEVVKEEYDRELSREEMLDLRVKAKKDKWCW